MLAQPALGLEPPDWRALLTTHYASLLRYSYWLATFVPLRFRDELVSQLLVDMTVAACGWDGTGRFDTHVCTRMRYRAIDWSRTNTGWSRARQERQHNEVPEDALVGTADWRTVSGQLAAETKALLADLAGVPDRERVALLAETDRDAADALGLSETRARQLRLRGRRRLRKAGWDY